MEDVFETWDSLVGHLRAQNGKDVEFSLDSFDRKALDIYTIFVTDPDPKIPKYVVPLDDGSCISIEEHPYSYKVMWDGSKPFEGVRRFWPEQDSRLLGAVGALTTTTSKTLKSILSK